MAGLLGSVGLLAFAGPLVYLLLNFMSASASRLGVVEICLLVQVSIMGLVLVGVAEIIDRSRHRNNELVSLLTRLSDKLR